MIWWVYGKTRHVYSEQDCSNSSYIKRIHSVTLGAGNAVTLGAGNAVTLGTGNAVTLGAGNAASQNTGLPLRFNACFTAHSMDLQRI
jgi:hypothetical protein